MSRCPFSGAASNNNNKTISKGSDGNAESTLNNWGCQVIKEGGLEFYIKTNKVIECRFISDEEPAVCPFKTTMTEKKQPIQNITAPTSDDDKPTPEHTVDTEDKEGYLTIPITNMPPFITFKETKVILLSLGIKLKDKTDNWDNLHFYYSLDSQNHINDNIELQEIIKEINQIIYLK